MVGSTTCRILLKSVFGVLAFCTIVQGCGPGQRERTDVRGNKICCFTTICNASHQFRFCRENNTKDWCEKCAPGTGTNDVIYTKDWPIGQTSDWPGEADICVEIPDCEGDDKKWDGKNCICNRDNGYYGVDVLNCLLDRNNCKKSGYELTVDGKCQKCGDGMFKPEDDEYRQCRAKNKCKDTEIEVNPGSVFEDSKCQVPTTEHVTSVPSTEISSTVTPNSDKDESVNPAVWAVALVLALIFGTCLICIVVCKIKDYVRRQSCPISNVLKYFPWVHPNNPIKHDVEDVPDLEQHQPLITDIIELDETTRPKEAVGGGSNQDGSRRSLDERTPPKELVGGGSNQDSFRRSLDETTPPKEPVGSGSIQDGSRRSLDERTPPKELVGGGSNQVGSSRSLDETTHPKELVGGGSNQDGSSRSSDETSAPKKLVGGAESNQDGSSRGSDEIFPNEPVRDDGRPIIKVLPTFRPQHDNQTDRDRSNQNQGFQQSNTTDGGIGVETATNEENFKTAPSSSQRSELEPLKKNLEDEVQKECIGGAGEVANDSPEITSSTIQDASDNQLPNRESTETNTGTATDTYESDQILNNSDDITTPVSQPQTGANQPAQQNGNHGPQNPPVTSPPTQRNLTSSGKTVCSPESDYSEESTPPNSTEGN